MRLCIVRHGLAEPRAPGASAAADARRALTPKGAVRTRAAALGLRRVGLRPERIGTSRLRRAEETARILRDVLAPSLTLERCAFLAPGAGRIEELLRWLRRRPCSEALLVGHMPDLAELASALLCGDERLRLILKKAAACGIVFNGAPGPGAGALEFLMQPGPLRGLAKRKA